MQQVRGVVAKAKGAPVSVETINIPDPGANEVVVTIQACGVCHTDLHYREGGINDDFPFLLGHEAAGLVETVGEGVTSVVPGDFVILNWRAVCGDCRACRRGEPWYCFATHNAAQKMTLEDGTELSAGPGHRRLRREDPRPRGPVHQGRPDRRPRRRGPARLRRHGRPGRRHQHRRRGPGQVRRRHRLRGRGRRGDRRLGAGRSLEDHRRRPRRHEAGVGQEPGRHPHREQPRERRRRGHPGPDRRQRRRCRHRRGRPPRDLEAGVLRPRPGRHRRAGRRAHPGHDDPRDPAHRRLRPWRLAQVELVRRLPAQPGLPDAGRPVPAGPARPGRASSPSGSASTTSRPPSRRCTAARCSARSWSS